MSPSYPALLVSQEGQGAQLTHVAEADLPTGDVTVAVERSALNYKDALAVTGRAPIVRRFPLVPGCDFVGTVAESHNPDFGPGERVILTGWGVGERHWGGYCQRARVMGDWLVRRPSPLDADTAAALGTAGLTAMLAVETLEAHGVTPDHGPVLVTGAGGGVGTVAVILLAALGYPVAAVTGRGSLADRLRALGAEQVLPRHDFAGGPDKPLERQNWAAVLDTVGGATLATALAQLHSGGVACAIGRAGGSDIPATVFPFILRGITLAGIESTYAPARRRGRAWHRLAATIPLDKLAWITGHCSLGEVPDSAPKLLAGGVHGRLVVDVAEAA